MSNGVAKLLDMKPKVREVDLLTDFYAKWKRLHALRKEGADRDILETAAQDLLEAHVAIDMYRGRFNG
jgi:hypothetical protein